MERRRDKREEDIVKEMVKGEKEIKEGLEEENGD